MKTTMIQRFAAPATVLALGLLGAAPVAAQTTTIPELATLTVTKTVVGTPPPGTTFMLHLTCVGIERPSAVDSNIPQAVAYDEDIEFGPAGGSKDFEFTGGSSCDVTETDDGGATSNSGPVNVVIDSPTEFNAEITNTFVAATTAAPPAAVAAVAAAPTFTG